MSAAVRRREVKNKNPRSSENGEKIKSEVKTNKSGAKIKSFLTVVFVIVVAAAIFVLFTNKYFFVIGNINISENEKYSRDEIMEILNANGIVQGGALYGVNINQVEENIKEIFTYAGSVNISRFPPSTLNVELKTERGLLGIFLGGDYYIVSDSFRVVDKIKIVGSGISESEFVVPEGIITFRTNAVKKCYIGKKIEFSDGDVYEFLEEIVRLYRDNEEAFSCITGIDITNKFKVVMNYEDKFLVKFGIFENISPKIFNSFAVIENLPYYAEGIIDMTDSKAASFTYDENVPKLYKSGGQKG